MSCYWRPGEASRLRSISCQLLSRNDGYGMENVPLHFYEPQAPPKTYPVGGKAETCACIEFFAVLPRAELTAEVKVWWAWAFAGARRAIGCHAKADNAQS
jgi:hypothetical protein